MFYIKQGFFFDKGFCLQTENTLAYIAKQDKKEILNQTNQRKEKESKKIKLLKWTGPHDNNSFRKTRSKIRHS